MKYLVCIAQKYTKTPLAICEVELKNWRLSDLIKKAEKLTGLKVNGNDNYIEWIEI